MEVSAHMLRGSNRLGPEAVEENTGGYNQEMQRQLEFGLCSGDSGGHGKVPGGRDYLSRHNLAELLHQVLIPHLLSDPTLQPEGSFGNHSPVPALHFHWDKNQLLPV